MTLKQLCVHVYDRHVSRGCLCLAVTYMPIRALLHEVRSRHDTFLQHSSLYLVRQFFPCTQMQLLLQSLWTPVPVELQPLPGESAGVQVGCHTHPAFAWSSEHWPSGLLSKPLIH